MYSRPTILKRLQYGRNRRRAFVRAGLRSDGKPLQPRKPCGCRFGSCLKCAKTTNALIIKPALVKAMYAAYSAGMPIGKVAEKFGRDRGSLRELFHRRGLALRPVKRPALGFGVRIPDPAEKEQQALIAGLTHLCVPVQMKQVWKRWTFVQRRRFIKKLRARFPSTRPAGPFSANVTPFEYGTPAAHAIAARLNRGRNSQTKVVALKPMSEGVIFERRLFFWTSAPAHGATGYLTGKPPHRTALHRLLWERYNRRPVPEKMTVIHKDGNKNNFAAGNLTLRSMADCVRQNAWHRRQHLFPGMIERITEKRKVTRIKNDVIKSRSRMSALLQDFQTPQTGGLLAALLRRK